MLICRYRPRGVPTSEQPWDAWSTALAPSKALHAAAYGKDGDALPFVEYEKRFRAEMERSRFWIEGFAERVAQGETLTLLCSSACTDEARCHRTIVKQLIEQAVDRADARDTPQRDAVKRRSRGQRS